MIHRLQIKTVKDFFQGLLALRLNLSVYPPLCFVDPLSGLNDNLNGSGAPGHLRHQGAERQTAEVVQSRQMEALRAQKIRLFLREGSLH